MTPPVDQLDLQHRQARQIAARDGYIAWRMTDVPAIYYHLMPPSYDGQELWNAEQAIRRQLEADVKLLLRPWRTIGPECHLLDTTTIHRDDQLRFMLEVALPAGMEEQPRKRVPGLTVPLKPGSVHPDEDETDPEDAGDDPDQEDDPTE